MLDATSADAPKAEEEQKEVNLKLCYPYNVIIFTFFLKKKYAFYQAELAVSKFSGNGAGTLNVANTVISTFVLVFVAEWGDKSFFSTIGESNKFVY